MYTLLIVDDEKWIRQGLAQAVDWRSLGIHTVREAENGEQALTLAMDMRPDVVITDIRMSGMGGLPLCEELRNQFPDIQLILISGYREFSLAHQAIRLGVADYLLKPIDEAALIAAVQRCLVQLERLRASALTEAEPAPGELHPAVRAVIQYIEQNYASKELTLTAAARAVNMNSSYLSKLFSEETNKTFTSYVTSLRVARAIELLANPGMKIYQVASNVGYPDVKYFVSKFKEVTGLTPTEWRQCPRAASVRRSTLFNE